MGTANGARGEVMVLLGGEQRRVCLTLGALAEIETGLGVAGLAAVAERMKALSACDLLIVLAALLRGGGEGQAAGQLGESMIDLREAAQAVALGFAAAAA
ncbi:GTA-gp10 family protein [Brevundimonas nasdae]|uniref:Gene transfer agent family protein n=1 Tax=Brevundimonas nasdae TaxID=172043 RepID=A0ABX8TCZ0_9CAUL|nr:GTA-gp10 family protein [Brevundimonas nasdae]QYC09046.1 gene transfer agent family protein [Brevundimonas nasdae]QYC15096.1 gene transfer agent family protein [Brevundimonas nasdae]